MLLTYQFIVVNYILRLLLDVFYLMVRIYLLMLVLLYIYINSTNILILI